MGGAFLSMMAALALVWLPVQARFLLLHVCFMFASCLLHVGSFHFASCCTSKTSNAISSLTKSEMFRHTWRFWRCIRVVRPLLAVLVQSLCHFDSFCVSWLKRVNRRQPRRHRLHAPVAVLVVLPQLLVAGHLLVLLLPAAIARPRQGTSVSVPLGILFVLDDSFTTQFLDR